MTPEENYCEVPPAGWYCTRAKGHDGPCAAIPIMQSEASEKAREADQTFTGIAYAAGAAAKMMQEAGYTKQQCLSMMDVAWDIMARETENRGRDSKVPSPLA